MPARQPAPMGRPSKITDVVDTRPDGTPVTVADRVLDLLRAGNYLETACGAAGVSKVTVYGWMRDGARLNTAVLAGKRKRLTAAEQRLADFVNAVAHSQDEAESRDVARLAQLANGGLTVVTTTEKVDGSGTVVEVTTKTENMLPSAQVLEWRLERRHPKKWGRQSLELSGPDGGPIPVEVQDSARNVVRDALERMAERLTAPDAGVTPPPSV